MNPLLRALFYRATFGGGGGYVGNVITVGGLVLTIGGSAVTIG